MKRPGDLLIGFDLGTSAIKALLVNKYGKIVARIEREVPLIHPSTEIYEIDPVHFYQLITTMIRELINEVAEVSLIRALSFCAASGNTVLLDRSYNPVRNVISWMDTRTRGKERELWPHLPFDTIHEIVGWPLIGMFPLTHLLWLKQNEPQNWENAGYFTMLNDYVYYRLGGTLVTDPSKATTFYLQDQKKRTWSDDLTKLLGIGNENLSKILPSGTVCGTLTRQASAETGLSEATQLITGSFDHPAAARSTGIEQQGDLLISAGTSWVAYAPVRNRVIGIEGGMLVDPFLSPEGCWGVMFALTAVAEKVNEYLDGCFGAINKEERYRKFNELSGESEPGAGGLFLNPWEQDYRTMAADLKNTDHRHIARALMEGCVYLMKNRVDNLKEAICDSMNRIVLTGGPTRSPIWPQILADVLGVPICIPETGQYAGALGAAIFAGVGSGVYKNVQEGRNHLMAPEIVIQPNPVYSEKYQDLYAQFLRQYP